MAAQPNSERPAPRRHPTHHKRRKVDIGRDIFKEQRAPGPQREVDVEEVRRARAAFFDNTPEEQIDEAREAQGQARLESLEHEDEQQPSVSPRRRPRMESEANPEQARRHRRRHHRHAGEQVEDDAVYVYRQPSVVGGEERSTVASGAHTAPAASSTTSLPTRPRISHDVPGGNGNRRGGSTLGLGQSRQRSSVIGEERIAKRPQKKPEGSTASVRPRPSRRASSSDISMKPAKPMARRSQTSAAKSRQSSTPLTAVPEDNSTTNADLKRSSSVFGSIFGPPRPSKPVAPVTCLTCLSDVPPASAALLSCNHHMCHACLKRIFALSVKDQSHMPPRCCTDQHILLKHVEKLFDLRFKVLWNKKYLEYTAKDRKYCPARGCGVWIGHGHWRMETLGANAGRKVGTCPKCKTRVCGMCGARAHRSKECPKDEQTAKVIEMAKDEGWARCFGCKALVELTEGCNHMTCRCGKEFCYLCGVPWKGCECPWFNYAPRQARRRADVRGAEDGEGNPVRYQQEIDRRRRQEQEDERLARRLQRMDADLDLEVGDVRQYQIVEDGDIVPAENDHDRLNARFMRRATEILAGPYNQDTLREARQLVDTARAARGEAPEPVPPRPPSPEGGALRRPQMARRATTSDASTRRRVETSGAEILSPMQRWMLGTGRAGIPRSEQRSEQAGLSGGGGGAGAGGAGRVREWRRHVS